MTIIYWSQPSSVALCIQNSAFSIRITSLYVSQTSPVDLWMQNIVLRSRMTLVYWSQPSSVVLYIQNTDFSIRNTSLYGSQPSFVVVCMQNIVISTWITRLHGSQTSPVVLCAQKRWLASELVVSMVPWPHLSFCACKTKWLASEKLVSLGPSHHVWFLHTKQRLLDQIYKSLWVPALICGFCMQNSSFWISITNLYGSQTSPVDLWMQNSVLRSRMTIVYYVPAFICGFLHSKQRL